MFDDEIYFLCGLGIVYFLLCKLLAYLVWFFTFGQIFVYLVFLCVHSNGEECPVNPMVCICGYFCWWSSSGGTKYAVLSFWHSGSTEFVYTYIFVLFEVLCISGKE